MPKNIEVATPEVRKRMLQLAKSSYRPPQILALKEAIEAETRVAELRATLTGLIDDEHVEKIVKMKLRLDGLYVAWIEGELEGVSC